jgi:hypothetical protein
MALRSTRPLTEMNEMNTRNFPWGKGWPWRKADNLSAICEPIVLKMWDPRHLTTIWTYMGCYRNSITFF